MRAGEYTLLRTLSTMTLSGNSEIQQVIGEALASRPYSHDQRAVTNVTAVITVEHDLRFLPRTLASVLRQSVLPSTIVIADCSGNTVQSVQTSFEIIPTVAEVYQEVPEPQRISVQLVRVTQAKSFADAVAKVLRTAAMPKGKLIGLDKNYALEMVKAGDVMVEYDKIIDRQLERAAITTISGYAKIFEDASRVLSV